MRLKLAKRSAFAPIYEYAELPVDLYDEYAYADAPVDAARQEPFFAYDDLAPPSPDVLAPQPHDALAPQMLAEAQPGAVLMKRAPTMDMASAWSVTDVLDGHPTAVAGAVAGVALVVAFAALVVVLIRRRTHAANHSTGQFKQFLLPTNVKPVISFKSQAGPGGLKNSPSPIQSPDQSMYAMSTAGRDTAAEPACDMSPVEALEKLPGPENAGEQKSGTLNFTISYMAEKAALMVTIASAKDLPPLPSSGGEPHPLDPYVKLQLLPEKQHKVKTRVVRGTDCPAYDEEFTFYGISAEQLQSTTLHFAVVAFDRYSRDEIIGEVVYPVNQVDLSDADKQAELQMPLISRSNKFLNAQNRGELLVSLCYQPGTNKITAVVLKAKNLPKFDVTGLADPYIKVYMMYNGQKLAKKKTHVKKRTLAPVYNEAFVFDLPNQDPAILDQISFELLVMDWDRVTKNEVMGRCVIGANARGTTGKTHWEQVRHHPRRQIAEWHRLRP